MRRRVGSLILAASLLLVLMPDTAMAARMEREAVAVQETAGRENRCVCGGGSAGKPCKSGGQRYSGRPVPN